MSLLSSDDRTTACCERYGYLGALFTTPSESTRSGTSSSSSEEALTSSGGSSSSSILIFAAAERVRLARIGGSALVPKDFGALGLGSVLAEGWGRVCVVMCELEDTV